MDQNSWKSVSVFSGLTFFYGRAQDYWLAPSLALILFPEDNIINNQKEAIQLHSKFALTHPSLHFGGT